MGVPEGFKAVLALKKLAPGKAAQVQVDGKAVALVNVDGEVFGIDGDCPHAGGPLGHGRVYADKLLCPVHRWGFDVRTGACEMRASIKVACYQVHVEGGTIYVKPQ